MSFGNVVCSITTVYLAFYLAVIRAGPVIIPADWRTRLTDDSYNYNLNKGSLNGETLFEGDIKGVDRVYDHPSDAHHDAYLSRNAIIDKSQRWSQGIVPYEIGPSFDADQKRLIEDALRDMMTKTCVRFVERTSEPDYISFINRNQGCSSYVARTGGQQMIDLMVGCLTYIGEPQHEVMHALGFYHEQSRTDRDQYVQIIWENIVTGAADQFKTYRSDNLDMPYDYGSIMHYGWNYFTKDPTLPTIIPKTSSKVELGTRKVMSPIDVEKINRLYECPGHARGSQQTPAPTAAPRTAPRTVRHTTPDRHIPGTAPNWNRVVPGTPPSWDTV